VLQTDKNGKMLELSFNELTFESMRSRKQALIEIKTHKKQDDKLIGKATSKVVKSDSVKSKSLEKRLKTGEDRKEIIKVSHKQVEVTEGPEDIKMTMSEDSGIKSPSPKESKAKRKSSEKRKADDKPKLKSQLSEISFFYEQEVMDEEDDKDEELDPNTHFILISAAHCQGKKENQCEDAYFISDRGFGVSDGVSGWNDYGFSSD